jgi:hypothetical protein
MEAVDNVLAVLAIRDKADFAQHAKVMRDVGHFLAKPVSQLSDVAWPLTQTLNDSQPLGVSQRL